VPTGSRRGGKWLRYLREEENYTKKSGNDRDETFSQFREECAEGTRKKGSWKTVKEREEVRAWESPPFRGLGKKWGGKRGTTAA